MSYSRTAPRGITVQLDHSDRAGVITPLLEAQPGSYFSLSPSGQEDVFSETHLTRKVCSEA